MKTSCLLIILLFSITDSMANSVAKALIRKLCNISTNIRTATHETKLRTLQDIEKKLQQSAVKFNDRDESHIQLIMSGLKVMVLNNDFSICSKAYPTVRKPVGTKNNTNLKRQQIKHETPPAKNIVSVLNTDEKPTIKKLLKQMIQKLDLLAKSSFKNITDPDERKKILDKIKVKVTAALKKKNMTKDSRNNSYADLIMEGIEIMLLNEDDPRRMTVEAIQRAKDLEEDQVTSGNSDSYVTTQANCEYVSNEVCDMMTKLNTFTCSIDETVVNIERLCDGSIDCPDASDELNCAKNAVKRVHSATEIMNRIDATRTCFTALIGNSILTEQGKLLAGLLQSEINFLNKYAKDFPPINEKVSLQEINMRTVQQLSNEVFVILHTFHTAMNAAFCVNEDDFENIVNHGYGNIHNNMDEEIRERVFSLRTCHCNGRQCLNSTCPIACKRICYQKYTLGRFACSSNTGDTSVPIDWLCDGKIDCFDEKDEQDCTSSGSPKPVDTRVESNVIYNELLTSIKTKTAYNEFMAARKKLIILYNAVKALQQMSIRHNLRFKVYSTLRDKCFKLLIDIYDVLINSLTSDSSNTEDIYAYLLSLNYKLVNALKLSHTGNEPVLPTDGCYCHGTSCAVNCTKRCSRTCAAKPLLTQYACSDNVTRIIPGLLCNGKDNCPNGDDEKNCVKERCRLHHLVVLRHHLTKVGDKHLGSFLGEALQNWKKKTMTKISIVETRETPSKHDMQELVTSMLEDLVDAYASLEPFRKVNMDDILQKFEKLAQRILDQLKNCSV